MGVPFDLPTHLRQCAEKTGADPAAIKTVAQLLLAFGDERAVSAELRACYAEVIRLVDIHNAAMTSGRLATK